MTLWLSYHPTKFRGHRHFDSVNVMVLAYHVMSQDHVMRGSCDFMRYHPAEFGSHSRLVVEL